MSPDATARTWAGAANPLGLTELEVATGMVLGNTDNTPWDIDYDDPLDALFDELRKVLQRGTCVIAFSGGRDSSALLAALLHVARRDGFDEPLAITARWPGDPASDESAWQEHVAKELGLRRWEIINPGTDFDLLGPLATTLLSEHGLLWPAPLVAFLPMIDAIGHGVLVSGQGGDEVFGTWNLASVWDNVRRRRRSGASARPIAGAALPGAIRRRRARAFSRPRQTWLTPQAREVYQDALAAEAVAVCPMWWPDYLREVGSERGLALANKAYAAVCESRGASFAAPLLAPTFLAALARRGGPLGLGDRTAAMTAIFSPLLDETILSRVSKATFGGAFWGPECRQFAEDWDGSGLDSSWVDANALRSAWREEVPIYGAALPLHAAWLAARAHRPLARHP